MKICQIRCKTQVGVFWRLCSLWCAQCTRLGCAEASPLSKLHKLYTASALVGSLFAYCTARGDHVSLCYVRADKTTGDHVSLCYVCSDETTGDHVSLCYVCSDKTTGVVRAWASESTTCQLAWSSRPLCGELSREKVAGCRACFPC